MNRINQPIGSDKQYAIPIIDGSDLPLDLTPYSKIELYLQYKNDITSLKLYSTDDSSLTILDATNGILSVIIGRDDITSLKKNDIYKTVKVYETDAEYYEGIAKIETDPSYFFTITKTAGYNG